MKRYTDIYTKNNKRKIKICQFMSQGKERKEGISIRTSNLMWVEFGETPLLTLLPYLSLSLCPNNFVKQITLFKFFSWSLFFENYYCLLLFDRKIDIDLNI